MRQNKSDGQRQSRLTRVGRFDSVKFKQMPSVMDLKIQDPPPPPSPPARSWRVKWRAATCVVAAIVMAALDCLAAGRAEAAPSLLVDADSGAVLYEDHATQPWFPASLTKLMTVYVALKAVRDHRLAPDAPLLVSARASAMPPSKMAFRPGTYVPLDAALKILMVKSANDVAVTVAEGVSGSVEAFAAEMNAAATSLGLQQSHFVNPNGLPNPEHYSSARDLAILARALYQTFPEQAGLFSIGALEVNGRIIANHNNLLGRYPGVDGMKTGFTCAAGFNVVASATQGGRKLIAVVLGAPNVSLRTIKAAALFDRGFTGIDRPTVALAALPLQGGAPPDEGNAICRNRSQTIAEFNAENEKLIAPLEAASSQAFASPQGVALYDSSALSRSSAMATRISLVPPPSFEPVPIRIAGYPGAGAEPRGSSDAEAPPEAVSAYAATKDAAAAAPLAPAKDALPLKGRARLRARALEAKAALAHARLQAHTHQVAEEGDGKTAAPAKGKAAHHGALAAKTHGHAKQSAAKASTAKVAVGKASSGKGSGGKQSAAKPHGGAVAKGSTGAKKAASRDE
jgi:D-alanyl-D-alanine carboxypeptidase